MKAWRSGRVMDYRSRGYGFALSLRYLVFSGHGALNVKLRTLEGFTLHLRNLQSGNLQAIEYCVFSIRSIERNMTSFLRTVYIQNVPAPNDPRQNIPSLKDSATIGHKQLVVCKKRCWALLSNEEYIFMQTFIPILTVLVKLKMFVCREKTPCLGPLFSRGTVIGIVHQFM